MPVTSLAELTRWTESTADVISSCHHHMKTKQTPKETRSLAVTKRPFDCCVGQFWPNITGR